jgi:hypothetical protein
MVAKLTRVTHKIAIQLHLVAESSAICGSRSRQPVRKLLDTPFYGSNTNRVRYETREKKRREGEGGEEKRRGEEKKRREENSFCDKC